MPCKEVLDELVVLVRSIAENQTSQSLNLMIYSELEMVSDMTVITTQDQVVEALVFMGGKVHQFICLRTVDTSDEFRYSGIPAM